MLNLGISLHIGDYFTRLLEEIEEIRVTEEKFYQKISDIYAESSFNCGPHLEVAN
ncbi:MAG: virulence RhuM family protein [Bacteroidetes bacterium]|nr:virulence RhuM family protein [Bacteroidota bacterium]